MSNSIVLKPNNSIEFSRTPIADGEFEGIVMPGTAAEALSFGSICYFVTASSKWGKADNDASGKRIGILGICVQAAAADVTTRILLYGRVRADTVFPALSIGVPAYLHSVAGEVTITNPTGTTEVPRIIGFGLTADELFFSPDAAINNYLDNTATGTDNVIYRAISSNAFYDHNAASLGVHGIPADPNADKFLMWDDAAGALSWEDATAAGIGAMAIDTLWDAVGDIAVGTGANTGARLAAGAEDTMLMIQSGTPAWVASGNGAEIAEVQAAGTGSGNNFSRADHVHAINHGITDNHILTVDQADAADNDYAKFTTNGLEGRSYSEVKTDLSLNNVENTAHSTDAHTMTIDGVDVSAHDIATTGVHGVGAGTIAKTSDITATKLDDFTAPDDNTDLDASTSKHGLVLKATAPAAGLYNYVGITNGETAYTNKALFDATVPSTQAFGDSAAAGTAAVAARRDHKHAMMAAPASASETLIWLGV